MLNREDAITEAVIRARAESFTVEVSLPNIAQFGFCDYPSCAICEEVERLVTKNFRNINREEK